MNMKLQRTIKNRKMKTKWNKKEKGYTVKKTKSDNDMIKIWYDYETAM